MSLTANWSYPTAIRFGAGRIAEIADACQAAGIRNPLLVTDRGLADLPITQHTLDLLDAAGLGRALFSDVDPNPNEKNAAAGVAAFHDGGHAGVVAFMAGQTRPIWDFEDVDDWWTRASTEGIAPIVAVPTTAGTGSEVGRACRGVLLAALPPDVARHGARRHATGQDVVASRLCTRRRH